MNQSALLFLLSTVVGSHAAAPSLRGVQTKPQTESRQLQEVTVMGECSLANFEAAYNGSNGDLASALGMDPAIGITEDELKAKCAAALTTNQM